ncbi:MAG TPA: hypothetical protein VJ861_03425 [Treponemataceae bacterium]|nr:hypothetical protein [Treponemataceae bacterium]
MRNLILWTEELDKAIMQTGFTVLDVSYLISVHFNDSIDEILSNSLSAIKKILNDAIPAGARGLIFSNFGMLLEPELHISVVKLLLDYAISYDLVIFWPHSIKNGRTLYWDAGQLAFSIDFSENILQHLEIKE